MSTAQHHDDLVAQRRGHPAWRLLVADNAALVLSFLERTFLAPNVRQLPGPQVLEALEDHLYALQRLDADAYPKSAEAYLGDWADPRNGWLRRSYPGNTDIAHYAPTAAVETAAAFVRSLGKREFLGTASRLLTVRDLLRQITAGAATDPEVRLTALRRQRAEIDEQIRAINDGTDGGLDDTAIRERYAQAVNTARELLADLREVEENFRRLDRQVRLQATTWDGPRGDFLSTVFGSTAEIGASDQGRSWKAFWEHMLSARQQTELDELLAAINDVPALEGAVGQIDQLLREELFVAADVTQRTVASLSAQLRRFLDERSWTESRRIHEVIRGTLAAALAARERDVRELGSEVPSMRADVALPLERPLYTPRTAVALDSSVTDDDDVTDVFGLTDLFDLNHIDVAALRATVADAVRRRGGHATLAQVVGDHPLTDGLAELVGYLQVSDTDGLMLSDRREHIDWVDATGRRRQADLPLILFGADRPPSPAGPHGRPDHPDAPAAATIPAQEH
jgi:hypothetical protein